MELKEQTEEMQKNVTVDLVLGNIRNHLINISTGYDVYNEEVYIKDIVKKYIMYLAGRDVNFFEYTNDDENYDVDIALLRIRTSLLYIKVCSEVNIEFYQDVIKKLYKEILDTVSNYADRLETKKIKRR